MQALKAMRGSVGWIALFAMVACFHMQHAVAAPTGAVLGIDLGSDNCVVAIARRKGVDIVTNEASARSTPTIVSFGQTQRFIGEAGSTQRMSNLKNTITGIKELVGGKFKEPSFKEEVIQKAMYKIEEDKKTGNAVVKATLVDKERVFTQAQVVSMMLSNLKKIAVADHKSEVTDCVIGVPVDWTEEQRNTILDAAELAGLKCLSLINENTATALLYGITKTDLPEDKPKMVCFVDVGYSSMQVSVVAFKKGQLKVMSHVCDRAFGGKDLDEMIFQHFADEFKSKYKVDARTEQKASLRLKMQVERLKKTLSANPPELETPINVECMMQDTDVSGMLTREQLEAMCADKGMFDKMANTCARALELAGVKSEELDGVEIVGGSSRIPALREKLADFFGKNVTQTLNAAESVARGASLACAMRSPAFKVREFKVADWNNKPIKVTYKTDDKKEQGEVDLEVGMEMPSTKKIALKTASGITLRYEYSDDETIPKSTPKLLAEQYIPLKADKADKKDPPSVKFQVGLDLSGCVTLEQCVIERTEDVPVTPAPAPKAAPKPDAAAAGNATAEGGEGEGDAKMEDAAAKQEPKADPGPPQMKTVTRQEKLTVEHKTFLGLKGKDMEEMKKQEFDMALQDRIVTETNEARNALEEYVYNTRDALDNRFKEFVEEGKREALMKQLGEVEEWIYGDGENAQKGVYVSKLEELKEQGGPVEALYREWESIPHEVDSIKNLVTSYKELAGSTDKKYEHITPEEREKVKSICSDAIDWAKGTVMFNMKGHDKSKPYQFTSEGVRQRRNEVADECAAIMERPKPAPAAPEKKEEEGKGGEGEKKEEEGGKMEDGEGGAAKEGGDAAAAEAEMNGIDGMEPEAVAGDEPPKDEGDAMATEEAA